VSELVTLLGDDVIGAVKRDRNGRVTFVYDEGYRRKRDAVPLSLSMPLAAAEHPHATVNAFLWGLLPDNERVLDAWGKRFHVSARNAFALLTHVGEDCAGAVRFATPDRAAQLAREANGEVEWLDEKGIGNRLRALREDVAAWRSPTDTGQFSLAGAQPKTALLFDRRRWGVPSGRIPTTHILKPGVPGLGGHAENEHFCLALAAELGLPVATSRIEHFDGEVAIVVERYDRLRDGKRIVRVHQEDVCQALAVHPEHKYENDGGPGARAVTTLLRNNSRAPVEDVETFVQALAFNWLIAATDGHAKNYSVLVGAASKVRLAPLYDIASALPYHDTELRKLKLAMKIGGKYRIREIGLHEWRRLAADLGFDEDHLVSRVREMAARIPDLSTALLSHVRGDGLTHAALARLADGAAERARECATRLSVSASLT
jgi:serine/threonine-protein kinase HipA